jgi:transposase InsO family protein
MTVAFVDQHREQYGVEPICSQIQIAPSSYYEHKARERDPDRLPDRIKRDRALEHDIQRVWENHFKVYGANKVWRQLIREGIQVARCAVERLMKKLGIQGIRRGKKGWTTIADDLLDEANIEASVGSVGDSYDNALAETINGLYKTEVIRHRGPWRNSDEVEFATLEWVDWFNHRRLLEPIGNIPPAEFELAYYHQLEKSADAA